MFFFTSILYSHANMLWPSVSQSFCLCLFFKSSTTRAKIVNTWYIFYALHKKAWDKVFYDARDQVL